MHDSIFKVYMVIYVYEKALAASFLLDYTHGQVLTNLTQIHHWENDKNDQFPWSSFQGH